jgi:hypothetical protein
MKRSHDDVKTGNTIAAEWPIIVQVGCGGEEMTVAMRPQDSVTELHSRVFKRCGLRGELWPLVENQPGSQSRQAKPLLCWKAMQESGLFNQAAVWLEPEGKSPIVTVHNIIAKTHEPMKSGSIYGSLRPKLMENMNLGITATLNGVTVNGKMLQVVGRSEVLKHFENSGQVRSRVSLIDTSEGVCFPFIEFQKKCVELVEKIVCVDGAEIILVDCKSGVNRSVTCVMLALAVFGMDYDDALNAIRKHRRVAKPKRSWTDELKQMMSAIVQLRIQPNVAYRPIRRNRRSFHVEANKAARNVVTSLAL